MKGWNLHYQLKKVVLSSFQQLKRAASGLLTIAVRQYIATENGNKSRFGYTLITNLMH